MTGPFLLAAAAAMQGIATTSVSPPPIIAVPSPPARALSAGPATNPAAAAVPFIVDVTVSAEGKLLWRGPLRVARGWGANFTQTMSQTPPAICPGLSRYDGDYRDMLAFHVRVHEVEPDSVNVSVNWQRPAADWSCSNAGLRTVQIGQTVVLNAGRSVTLEGDAGLRITLTRR